MKKTSLALMAVCGIFLAACSKNNDDDKKNNNPTPKTRAELLAAGRWRIIESKSVNTETIGSSTTVDSSDDYADMAPCERDDIFLFGASGVFTKDEGATKCSAGNPQTKTIGNWSLIEGDTKLRVDESGDVFTYTINELSETRLRFSLDTTFSLGSSGGTSRLQATATLANP